MFPATLPGTKLYSLNGIWKSLVNVKLVALGTAAISNIPSYAPLLLARVKSCHPVPPVDRVIEPLSPITSNLISHQLVIPEGARSILDVGLISTSKPIFPVPGSV